MDLKRFGLNITLQKGMNLETALISDNLAVGYYSKHRGVMVAPSGRYKIGAFLGSGSFARIFQGTHETTNQGYSLKFIPTQKASVASIMRECIVHILLERESAKEAYGPYVPRFYEVIHDPYNHLIVLRTETIQDILYDRYKAGTPLENDVVIPHTMAQIAHILDFFYRRLRFNHRDFKPDNVLYNYDPATGRFDVKIIDFGFACLRWQGISIRAGDRFAAEGGGCYLPSRDLTQFVYATYSDSNIPKSPRLRLMLEDVLTFEADGRPCRMWESCRAYGNPMSIWGHTYRFLNDRRMRNPAAEPAPLRSRMMRFLGITEAGRQTPMARIVRYGIVGMPHCTPDRVLNPRTRRCVRRSSPAGRAVTRISKRYSTPSPKTLRAYRKSKVVAKGTKGSRKKTRKNH